ncbi:hypothetical protein MHM88_22125 [Epibacterium sp. MM17-32]|uniref:hypothetical protein n=1 Tax=Epibacterium sp. MM17-32 TaxID=2917734 RepID=UPI001EF601D1|nr:hypothetical protein [Epibacterium sp. MM17-32]MCG7630509.1 hypothetical protein [Epibacterium sp. MM17-32]
MRDTTETLLPLRDDHLAQMPRGMAKLNLALTPPTLIELRASQNNQHELFNKMRLSRPARPVGRRTSSIWFSWGRDVTNKSSSTPNAP